MAKADRKSQRIEITLDARVVATTGEERCQVQNFCQGGLFVEYDGMHSSNGRWKPRRGEQVKIAMDIPGEHGESHFILDSRVAHLNDSGFGVSYDKPELGVWYALMRMRKERLHENRVDDIGQGQGRKVHAHLIETLKQRAQDAFSPWAVRFVEKLDQALVGAVASARNKHDESDYQTASTLFRREGPEVVADWLKRLDNRFDTLASHGERKRWSLFGNKAKSDQFELVEKDRFDDWVMIAGLASKVDAILGSALFELEGRLSVIVGRDVQRELNPVSPHSLLSAFEGVIEPHKLTTLPRKLIYELFEKEILDRLEPLYQSFNEYLYEEGILLGEEVDDAPACQSVGKPGKKGGDSQEAGEEKGKSKPAKRGVLGSLYRMFSPASKKSEEEGEARPEEEGEKPPTYDRKEALEALSQEPGESDKPLEERLESSLKKKHGKEAGTLSDEVRGTVRATSGLVESMRSDEGLDPAMQRVMQKLEAPLAKAALENPEALADNDSPAATLLNDLGKLSMALSSESPDSEAAKKLKASIEEAVESLSDGHQTSPEAFARAQQMVTPLVNQYQRMFSASAKRLADGRKGQQRLLDAKSLIKGRISEQLTDETTPRVLVQFIRNGWDALLVQTLLRQGEESKNLELLLIVIQRLVEWFAPKAAFPPAPAPAIQPVMAAIIKGYRAMPANPTQQEKIIKALRVALLKDARVFGQLQGARLATPEAIKMIMPEVGIKVPPDEASKETFGRWQGAIDNLKVGDWLIQRKEDGQSRPLSITFISDRRDAFLLVDGKGAKAMDCDQYALASGLDKVELMILEDGGLPLVQRAVQRVLKDTYEKMLENSETDSLTGLMNRRAFTKCLDRGLQRLRSEGGHDVLVVVDVDRFKVINDLCGYEGGDRLLINITHILQTYLDPEAQVARVGDDEFGVLIPHCGREAGFEIAETQRRALENYVFNWHGRRLPISASLGLVLVDAQYDSASVLLKDADSAAYLAKHAGRNTTKIYALDDKEVQWKRDQTQAVELVEEAIQNGRLQIYLQRISTLFFEDDEPKDRYEVLLRMLDRKDQIVEPKEFIEAAEGYNRMRTLDRWVIEHLFAWIDEQGEQLEEVGGFCFNLSDQSLLDPGILDLIAAKVGESPIAPDRITFEINESVFAANNDQAHKSIRRLKRIGCQFSLDNFGKGVASFSYLKEAPVSTVKIDGELIQTIAEDENHYALVKSITEICHFMKKEVVAEKVENEGIIVKLRELEVDYIQGYAVGLPFALNKLFEQL
jgi:diguanylate cyclase (GGDEF)-like protein